MGRVAIIGLGLIGGSMGLAIKRAEPVNTTVVGFDRDADVGRRAREAGAVQELARSVEDAVADATLVIIATPILSVRRVLEQIAPRLKPRTVVTDTASTKGEVLRWADSILPAEVHFVGGHPMAGKEKSGPSAAEETLFDGRPYIIVPSNTCAPWAVQGVIGLAETVGGVPTFLDAGEHDAYTAAISHVPLVSSIALFNLVRASSAWPELAGISGPAFRDLTRLASGEPEMAHDIFMTNRDNVVHWLQRYIAELQRLSELIGSADAEALFRSVAETQLERDNFLLNPPKREEVGAGAPVPAGFDSFMGMMGGMLWQNRAKEITETLEEQQREHQREDRLRRRIDD